VKIQRPTIGRVVLYKSYGTPNGEYKPESRAAIITRVSEKDPTVVGLCIMNPTGLFFNDRVNYGKREGQWQYPEIVKEEIEIEEVTENVN
jgi:hypothetical protein